MNSTAITKSNNYYLNMLAYYKRKYYHSINTKKQGKKRKFSEAFL